MMMTDASGASETPLELRDRRRASGRCHWCGYSLEGLPWEGVCPECGVAYTNASALRLKRRPSAWSITLRLIWPFVGMLVPTALAFRSNDDRFMTAMALIGGAFLLALPVNSYYQVRSMLKKHLPEQRRTRGTIAALRGLGTALCIVAFITLAVGAFLLGVFFWMMSNVEWN